MTSIEDQPSPFLDGSFDFIVKKNQAENKYNLHATVEGLQEDVLWLCFFAKLVTSIIKK